MSRPDGAGWSGRRGQIDAALLAVAVPDIAAHRAHICGPPAMMDAVKEALIGLGMSNEQIRTEAFGTIKRDPTAKGAASTAISGNVFFQVANTTAPVVAGSTILEAADEAEVFIDNACRSGTCGSCRVKLTSGVVRMAVEDALTKEDKAGGYILACQAEISGDVVVDA
jgi:ferredoxin